MNTKKISPNALFISSILLILTHWQCSHKNSTDSQDPQSATSPDAYVPDQWDGSSDWNSSDFEVQDIE